MSAPAYLLLIGEPETHEIYERGLTMVTIGETPEAFVFTDLNACAEFVSDRFPDYEKLTPADLLALGKVMGGLARLTREPTYEVVEKICGKMFVVRAVSLIERKAEKRMKQ